MPLFDEDEVAEQLGVELNKGMSFGGEGEELVDVLDRGDVDAHERGLHDEPRAGCPRCEDEDRLHECPVCGAVGLRERIADHDCQAFLKRRGGR